MYKNRSLNYLFPYRHRIESGVWSDKVLAYYDGQGYTIRDAINYWYWNVSGTEESVVFRDVCSGPHCSNVCPEVISLVADNTGNMWSGGARIAIAVIVLLISVICLVMKVSIIFVPIQLVPSHSLGSVYKFMSFNLKMCVGNGKKLTAKVISGW